jgi:hypothetical protein
MLIFFSRKETNKTNSSLVYMDFFIFICGQNFIFMKDTVEKYLKLGKTRNHRYKSWEHCFLAFSDTKEINAESIDYLSLHLAFYLASWGMYRGSSQLLQHDYRIHVPIVEIILSEKAQSLKKKWIDQSDIAPINDLLHNIKDEYKTLEVSATETLLTKILLGTLGCAPAFDRYFREGWKDVVGIDLSIENVVEFASNHKEQIEECPDSAKYPSMKVLDMYFWQHGYDIAKDKK